MTTWTSLEPQSVTAEAGGSGGALLRIRNTSDVVEEYHVDVVGEPAAWCTVEPVTLRLYPGTTGEVRLTFAPPRGPDPAAGPHPYGVRVSPRQAPDAVTVTEGNVSVAPFADMRAELLPVMVRGWRKAKPKLAVDNYGNTLVTASVQAAVQDNSVDFETRTPSFQVEPGRAHFAAFTGRPSRTLWFGRKVNHPFTATVTPSGGPAAFLASGASGSRGGPGSEATKVTGTYVQTALLPSWLSRMLMLLIPLLIVAIALWFYAKPSVTSEATAQISSTPAAVSEPTTSASASASPSASASAAATHAAAPPAVAATPQGQAPAVTLPRALGYWKLNDGDDGDAAANAADSSGNGHPATGANAAWCSGTGCAWFNGTSSDFTTSGSILSTGASSSFTVAAYVDLDTIPANGAFATAVSQDSSTNSGFYLQYSGQDKCWAFSRVTPSPVRALGCTGNYTNTWTFLTGTFNASTQKLSLYVNGKLTHTVTDTAPNVSDGPLAIGRGQSSSSSTDWWPGWIMQVRVYQKVLNAKQVQLLYKTTPTNGT